MTRQRVHKFLAKTHKWVGLILGLQVLAWTIGGVVMTWIPINEVRGEHNVTERTPSPFSVKENYLSFNELIADSEKPIVRLTYDKMLAHTVVKVLFEDDSRAVLDAQTGKKISPIGHDLARTLAQADFAPDSTAISVKLHEQHTIDYRGPLPVWRVTFDDEDSTAIYVSPDEARVVARRSATWRLFDFFWMLHIMDYEERDDINNPLLMAFALFAALFTISGVGLLYFRISRREFNWLLGRKRKTARADTAAQHLRNSTQQHLATKTKKGEHG